jgi:catechol-2,3-dioxygenase
MKRFHVHLGVQNLEQSIAFYQSLFNAPPSVVKADYAKWMLEDPKVNFAISAHSNQSAGLQHLGIQVDSQEELQDVYQNMENAEGQILNEGHTTCCYAKSEKSWIADPQNVSWEVFRTYGDSTVYSKNIVAAAPETMEKWEGNDMKIAEAKPAFELQTCCAPTCCN